MALPFFTIGHSNRSLEEFIELLKQQQAQRLVDVRTVPKSRANPQFNTDTLPRTLAEYQISYEHVAALGGFRVKAKNVPADLNGFWENQSFRNYADYALTEPFQRGVEHLIQEGRKRRCAIMCSEAVWWRCHRRIITDYLLANGETVFHIMANNRIEEALLTPGAIVRPDKTIIYPEASSTD